MRSSVRNDGTEWHLGVAEYGGTRPGSTQQSSEGDNMKVRNSLGSIKKMQGSQIVKRRGRTFVINKENPRFKSRQG